MTQLNTGGSGMPQPAGKSGGGAWKIIVIVLVLVGLLGIAICGGLVAILLPAIGSARQQARQMQSLSQMRQMTIGMISYAADWDGALPRHVGQASPYFGGPATLFVRPVNKGVVTPPSWVDMGGSESVYRYGDYFFAHAYEQSATTDELEYLRIDSLPSADMIVIFGAKLDPSEDGRPVAFADGSAMRMDDATFEARVQQENAERAKADLPPIDLDKVRSLE